MPYLQHNSNSRRFGSSPIWSHKPSLCHRCQKVSSVVCFSFLTSVFESDDLPKLVWVCMFQRGPRLHPQISQLQTLLTQVVRRRQVRIGIRGRIVTIEVHRASIVTIVSIASAQGRAKTRTYRLRGQAHPCGWHKGTDNPSNWKYKKPPSAVLMITAEDPFFIGKEVCQRTYLFCT